MSSPRSDLLAASYKAQVAETATKAQARIISAWRQELAGGMTRESADRWLDLAVRYLIAARKRTAKTAQGYYLANRLLEAPGAPRIVLPPIPEIDPAQLRTSLWVTGPNDVLRNGADPLDKMTSIEGAVKRHALNGGRAQIEAARQVDTVLQGFYRDTGDDPCYFCIMLASRGVVYSEDSFDSSDPRFQKPKDGPDGGAKVHDSCECFNRPSYVKGVTHPGRTKDAEALWKSQPAPKPGEDPINAWRRYYDSVRSAPATMV